MRALLAVVAALFVMCGCAGAPAPPTGPSAGQPPEPTPSARPDPVQVCVNQLTYWAGEDLRGAADEGYDYQHRGLTSDQADALAAIEDAARRAGPAGRGELVDRLTRDACTRLASGPVDGVWGY